MRSNGPELSCGDVQRRRGSHSARGMSSPIVTGCFARIKSPTAISVSLSDWLGSAIARRGTEAMIRDFRAVVSILRDCVESVAYSPLLSFSTSQVLMIPLG